MKRKRVLEFWRWKDQKKRRNRKYLEIYWEEEMKMPKNARDCHHKKVWTPLYREIQEKNGQKIRKMISLRFLKLQDWDHVIWYRHWTFRWKSEIGPPVLGNRPSDDILPRMDHLICEIWPPDLPCFAKIGRIWHRKIERREIWKQLRETRSWK